jgi:flagellar hook-associated protein 1 FlgK
MTQISTFFGLQQTLRGLLAHQRAIETTGHNITNANTEGYSRQQAVFTAANAYDIEAGLLVDGGGAQLGSGVDLSGFNRIRDQFLDLQYRAQHLRQQGFETTAASMAQVEEGLSEPGENGIAQLLNDYWTAWSTVSTAPEANATATRAALLEQGKTLVAAVNDFNTRLNTIASQTNAQYAAITGATGDVQSYASELAKLNGAIKFAVADGDSPNDLYDRRDLLLDKLSGLAQVSVVENADGSINVNFGDAAVPLVADATVTWPQALTAPGGKLGALIDLTKSAATGGVIENYRVDLNAFAKQLADSVNTLHNPGGTGTDFFSYGAAGTEAATLTVNATLATIRTATGAAAGANDIAIAIAKLRSGTADQSYGALVTRIGADVRNTERLESNAKVLADNIDDRRQSIAGVSMDEEMTNLLRFQRGYQASARAMNAVDEMLDNLINRTGRVGL